MPGYDDNSFATYLRQITLMVSFWVYLSLLFLIYLHCFCKVFLQPKFERIRKLRKEIANLDRHEAEPQAWLNANPE